MGNVKTYNPWPGEKMKERVYLMFLASFSHRMKPISHTPAGRCTSQSKHTWKWNVRTFRVTKTNCALGRNQSRALVNQSAVQHSRWKEQLSISKWQQWKTPALTTKGRGGGQGRTGGSQQRKKAAVTTGSMQPPRVWPAEKKKIIKMVRGRGGVFPQQQAAPNQADSTRMNTVSHRRKLESCAAWIS